LESANLGAWLKDDAASAHGCRLLPLSRILAQPQVRGFDSRRIVGGCRGRQQ